MFAAASCVGFRILVSLAAGVVGCGGDFYLCGCRQGLVGVHGGVVLGCFTPYSGLVSLFFDSRME